MSLNIDYNRDGETSTCILNNKYLRHVRISNCLDDEFQTKQSSYFHQFRAQLPS